MKILAYISIVFLVFFSCKKPENRICYKSTGTIISEERALADFSVIVLNDNIELNLTQSNTNKANISAGKNLINFINTDVSGDTLYISNENKCNNLRSRKKTIEIDLNLKQLKRIQYFGLNGLNITNTLKSDTLIIESFEGHGDVFINFEGNYLSTIFHSGTANVFAKGNVIKSYAYQISNGYTDYSSLNADNCHLHSRTIQDCFMNAKNELSVEIHGAGDVYYKNNNNLSIKLKGEGSGKLIAQ